MNRYRIWTMVALLLLTGGCSLGKPTRPSEFYVLSAEAGTPVAGRAHAAKPLALGLGPIEVPDILDRPQIVTRPQPNRITLAEYDRWGGDLRRDLARVLSQNLMSRLDTDSVVLYPWSVSDQPELQVSIRFFRFDGELGKAARLEGVWRLLDGRDGCELAARRFRIEERPAGGSYEDFVAAMSHGVARLSQEIAERVAAVEPGCAAQP